SPERSVRLRVSGEVAPSAPPARRAVGGLSHSGSTAFCARLVAAAHERWPRDGGRGGAAPDVDGHPGALLDIRPEKGKRDAAFEHGREVSARDLPHGFISRLHRVAGTGDLPAREHEPAQSTADTALAYGEERRATTEVALVETHDPREARLQRRDARPEFVAVQRQPCFEAEGVARAEPGGADPGIEEKPPNGRRD